MKFSLDSLNESPIAPQVDSPVAMALMDSSLVTTRRSRPPTRLTPDPKRRRQFNEEQDMESENEGRDFEPVMSVDVSSDQSTSLKDTNSRVERSAMEDDNQLSPKWNNIEYPREIPAPPKSILSALLTTELVTAKESDQEFLKPAGILSFEQVLLPALALQEEYALKRLQAKIQRDAPEYKQSVEQCRRLVRRSILRAMEAVKTSRQQRLENQHKRRQDALERRRIAREEELRKQQLEQERMAEEARQKAIQDHLDRFRSLQRQYPRNKDLWKEIVVLTRSRTQLEKEQRLWKQAEEELPLQRFDEDKNSAVSGEDDDTEDKPSAIQAEKDIIQEKTEDTVEELVLASRRIQSGLQFVLQILQNSETLREELYREYTSQHQFAGYQGVRNPKGLIRFLSQED